jgi:hypothetical protein
VRGQTGKGANRALFFGAESGNAQMAKNRPGCLFRALSLWFISLGEAREMNINKEKGSLLIHPLIYNLAISGYSAIT